MPVFHQSIRECLFHRLQYRHKVTHRWQINSMINQDTIAAQATAPGRGGVGIIRVSGSLAKSVAEKVVGKIPKVRYADYVPFKSLAGEQLDQGISVTIAASRPARAFSRLDLPAFGRPAITTRIPSRMMLPCLAWLVTVLS